MLPCSLLVVHAWRLRPHDCSVDLPSQTIRGRDVMNAGPPLILLAHGVQANEVLLRVASNLYSASYGPCQCTSRKMVFRLVDFNAKPAVGCPRSICQQTRTILPWLFLVVQCISTVAQGQCGPFPDGTKHGGKNLSFRQTPTGKNIGLDRLKGSEAKAAQYMLDMGSGRLCFSNVKRKCSIQTHPFTEVHSQLSVGTQNSCIFLSWVPSSHSSTFPCPAMRREVYPWIMTSPRTCVGVRDMTKFREMDRQSPLPNLARPMRNRRCSSSVQGMPFRRS
jgi:hypothetical protein